MTDPRIQQRRVEVARAAGRRRLHFVVAGLVVAALAASSFAVLHSPLMAVRHVTVVGAPGVPRAEVLTAAGLSSHPPLVDVDTAAVARRVAALPEVASVAVHEQWPTGVEIVLTERVPVAAAAVGTPAGAGTMGVVTPAAYAELDAAGRVLAIVAQRPAGLALVDLPAEPGPPGSLSGALAVPLIAAAAAVPAAIAAEVESVGYDGSGAIVLQLQGHLLAILGSMDDLRQKMEALRVVLSEVSTSGIATVDLSVPTAPVLTPTGVGPTVQGIAGG